MGGTLTGADIAGLNNLEAQLKQINPQVTGSVKALNKSVATLVTDTGWQGSAASAFKDRWDNDGLAGSAIAQAITDVAAIVKTLAANLTTAENTLEQALAIAQANGVPTGPNGEPFIGPVPMDKAADVQQYDQVYEQTMGLADQARRQAISQLQQVLTQIQPEQGLTVDQKSAIAKVLTGLYTLPVTASDRLENRLTSIRLKRANLKHVWRKMPKDTPEDVRQATWEERRGLWAKQFEADTKLSKTEAAIQPLMRLLNTPVSAVVPALADSDVRIIRLLSDTPLVGVGLAAVVTAIEMDQDMTTRHWSFWHALAADAPPNFIALGVETLAVAGLATLPIDVPTVAIVGAGVAIGYGIGSYGYELTHVDWGANIHQDGVVGGTLESFKDAGVATWQNDLYGLYASAKHPVTSLWHDVTGVF